MKIISIINRFYPYIFLVLSPLLLLYLNCKYQVVDFFITDEIHNKVEIFSWMFAGILSIVSIFALFIGFVYENKLLSGSRNLRIIYNPIALNTDEFKQRITDYQRDIVRGHNVNVIFYNLLLITFCSIFSWGLVVMLYMDSDYKLGFSDLAAITNTLILIFWGILTILLVSLTYLLNNIRLNKDPLEKGMLPTLEKLSDFDFINNQNIDTNEFLRVISPEIRFYQNNTEDNNDVEVFFPVKFKNIKVVIRILDKDKNLVLRIFGVCGDVNYLGESVRYHVTSELTGKVYRLLYVGSSAEYRYYDTNNQIITRVICSLTLVKNSFTLIPIHVKEFTVDSREIDFVLIQNIQTDKFVMQNESQRIVN
ncbi:hypothetical protein ACFQZE_08370 [Paenibacillus sp. GCM10027627]|uniref:hypothetical protein n=1 Tax=unclassified Paenibacillus TaxID=185978 RepID=UPI0036418C7A